jgi:hypothetical protein
MTFVQRYGNSGRNTTQRMLKKRKRKMVSLTPTEQQELDLSTVTIDAARLLVQTLHNLNARLTAVEAEVRRLKKEGAR